jgi:hypothetical protein
MSDSLPENPLSGVLRVVKLTSGEELIGLVSEPTPDKINLKLPAKLENYLSRDPNGETVEYVKLTNYLANIRGFEVNLPKDVIIYIGLPALELEKMYEVFFMTMQNDPKAILSSSIDQGPESGLQMLNELFTNEDFVNFVNDLIDSFEGAEILIEDEDEEAILEGESSINDSMPTEEPEPQPKPKKRKKTKPEPKKLPYNPDLPAENPESWSDNPEDYI